MKITIDARPAMLQRSGIGHYTYNLLKQLVRIAPEHEYYLSDVFAGMGFYNMLRVKRDLANADRFLNLFKIPFPFVTLSRLLLLCWSKLRGEATRIEQTDVFFGTNFRGIFDERLKTVITVHDMAHEYFPETIRDEETIAYLKKELPEAARRAHRIIAVSETTRSDVIRFLGIAPEKVRVVYNGVDEAFRPIDNPALLAAARERYRLPARFILFVGAIQPRKNILGVVEAYARICGEAGVPHDLVIAGGDGWKSEGLTERIAALGLEGKIHFTGYVADADLPLLYNLADLFVFPSFYEGFGLPVLEAMACGVPVVTSSTSSLPEIAGDAAVLVDPASPDEIGEAMRRLLTDHELKGRCREKGMEQARRFTWERCARETLAVLLEAREAA